MDDLIRREQAIDALNGELIISGEDNVKAVEEYIHTAIRKLNDLPSIDAVPHEPLTDNEQRIFLSAMSREVEVCQKIDDETWREPYEYSLVFICNEIKRKVKGSLWT